VIHTRCGETKTWEIRELRDNAPLPADLDLGAAERDRLVAAVRSTVLWQQRVTKPRPALSTVAPKLTEVLGLPRDAGDDAIRDRYRVLSHIFHPDRYEGATPAVRDEAARRMRDLNAAYAAWRARVAA
jgi:hypothetical protein